MSSSVHKDNGFAYILKAIGEKTYVNKKSSHPEDLIES
ncbi:hypothetical protein SAMN05444001_12135 [Parabacteroides chinchillae]|uniref:Uncharacterized protein n=1 Tax=Parabacteroides chinchillae TaxID=871327 RepID=A0A8G2BYN7_9BACT|nr:hypothetical protein SAMN05444001_12135 [Parabacteroides chinchillae]